jgi:hypothetical protein
MGIVGKLKQRLKDESGSMLIEYVLGGLMFVVFVAFCLDLLGIATRHHLIGQEMNTIARTLSVQSGTTAETPHGFPGGDQAYFTSSEILDRMKKVAHAAGFRDGEWELYLEETDANGNVVRSGVLTDKSNFQCDYLDKISIQFRGTYQWGNSIASGIPGISEKRYMNVERIVMAEYLRNYDR